MVTEANSLASEGFGSDRGQNEKKILGENFKIANFDLQKGNIPQRKPHENRHSH